MEEGHWAERVGIRGGLGGWVSCPGGFLLLSASCPP